MTRAMDPEVSYDRELWITGRVKGATYPPF